MQDQHKQSYERNLIRKAILYIEEVTKTGEVALFEGFNEGEKDMIRKTLKKFCAKFDLDKNFEQLMIQGEL